MIDAPKSAVRRWMAAAFRARLFILLAVTYAYFYEGGDPNQATRMFLTRSLVERHEPDITPYHRFTIDKSEFDGKFWCDKAPAVSMLATIPYATMNVVDRTLGFDRDSRVMQRIRLHMIVLVISAASGVIASIFVRRSLRLFGATPRLADLLTAGYALGTLAFPFSTVLFGHQTAAAMLAASFYFVVKTRQATLDGEASEENGPARLALLGALWGLVMTTEYPTGLLVACQGLYLLSADRRVRPVVRVLAWSAAGAFAPLVIHSAFLWWAFGSPFSLPYSHMAEPIFLAHVSTGVLGINLPSLVGLFGSFLSRYRGIFFFCPFLICTLVGLRSWIASGERRAELALCAAQIFAYVFFCAGYYAWDGGGSTGPRHLVPALPFFVIPIVWFARSKAGLRWTLLSLVPSVIIMLACTATRIELPEGDPWRANPLYEIIFATLARGEIAVNRADIYSLDPRGDASYNLGSLMGLTSVCSLLPLLAIWLAAYVPSGFVAWRRTRSA
ncbi:hypothetical protein AKJ09_03574 [Labilithrix luteola]|uniref:Glycosyltransferase RgtA/B/C/D-like domain-containing protein n=1 Tax=Labilithrix luteola TaxID=1391654 RepID=A0A0K1PTQ0_9BACT|nr:hypothetical protein [Labilithrix luteola]AKU96910.1 hypothetical protein AKJ09_03574 [Labilithrix luteola]